METVPSHELGPLLFLALFLWDSTLGSQGLAAGELLLPDEFLYLRTFAYILRRVRVRVYRSFARLISNWQLTDEPNNKPIASSYIRGGSQN